MILLVDVGNTRLKWATLHNDYFEYGGAISHETEDLFSLLTSIWLVIQDPEQVLIANVAGDDVAEVIDHWVLDHFNCPIEYIATPTEQYGLVNGYRLPQQLGIDRWLAMLAVWNEKDKGFCLVSAGTALTFDAVDDSGKHLGGFIIPGIDMMHDVLVERLVGCRKHKIQNANPSELLADNTYHAMTGGALYAAAAFINSLTEDVINASGMDLSLVITGGNAHQLKPMLAYPYEHESHLVLHGLALLD